MFNEPSTSDEYRNLLKSNDNLNNRSFSFSPKSGSKKNKLINVLKTSY